MYEIRLGLQALLRNRKRTITTSAIVTLLMVFIILLNAIIYTDFATKDLQREMIYGSWSHAFYEDNKSISFDLIGTYHRIADSVGSFDDNMFKLSNFEYLNGRQAQNESEIVITIDEIHSRGLINELNQIVTVDGYEFEVVGIIYSYYDNWIELKDNEYPSIITTNIKSSDTIRFGKAKKISRLYEPEEYLSINTYAYPFMDQHDGAANIRFEETLLMDQKSFKLTQFMLVVVISVIFIVFKNNAKFYHKRLDILKQQGMSFEGVVRYLLPQVILIMLLVPLMFHLIPQLFEWIVLSLGNNRYDNSISNLSYARNRLIWFLVVIFIISFVSLKTRQRGGLGYRIIQFLMVMIISYPTLFLTTPTTIDLVENRLPEWKKYDEIRQRSLTYLGSGSMSLFLGEIETEWSSDEFVVIKKHPKTKYLFYWNRRVLKPTTLDVNPSEISDIVYFNNDFIDYFEPNYLASDDFIRGNSFYYYGDNEIKYKVGDIVLFNDVPFYYEKKFGSDQPPIEDFPLFSGAIISEEGAKRIDFPTNKYNVFKVGSEDMSDFLEYDFIVRKVSKGSYFENNRLEVERWHNQLRGITIFMVLEVLLQYILTIAILALLYLQKLLIERKSMAVFLLLGESKIKMTLKNAIIFVYPIVIPLLFILFTTKAEFKILLWNFMVGLLFMLVLWTICVLIQFYYLKDNTFGLLDERE